MDEKKQTKIEALETAIELWTWLTQTGDEWKSNWPGWRTHPRMIHDCPLCEFVGFTRNYMNCNNNPEACPVQWPTLRGKPSLCESSNSPYEHWCTAYRSSTRKKYAAQVLRLLQEALERTKKQVNQPAHKVTSCIFWGDGCTCHSGKRNEIFNVHRCCGRDECGSYEYLTKWARYAHRLGKKIQSKREGWLEATWIPKQQ